MILMAEEKHLDLLVNVTLDVMSDLPNYAGVAYDKEHTRSMLTQYLNCPGLAIFFEEIDGVVTGLYMGIVAPQWFTPTLEMSELMFWVHRDFRCTTLARRLIKTMEAWAISEGAKKLFLAAASGYETDRVMTLYDRMGYRSFSRIACKEVG